MPTLLENFNKLGFIEKLDGSDERFEKIEQASQALKDRFEEKPSLMLRAVLAALDPDISSSDPSIVLAEEALLDVWKAMLSVHTDPPIQLYRAIILDACNQLSEGINAVILWNTITDTLPTISLGRERDLLVSTFQQWARNSEEYSLVIPEIIGVKRAPANKYPQSLEFQSRPTIEIDSEKLKLELAGSAHPNYRNQSNPDIKQPNPHYSHNSHDWAWEFSDQLTNILSRRFNNVYIKMNQAIEGIGKEIKEQDEQRIKDLKTLLSSQRTWLQQTLEENQQSKRAEHQRLNTLWWSEALYSPSMCISYRELEPMFPPVVMALDLLNEIAIPTPASVGYALSETVGKLPNHGFDKAYKLVEVLDVICAKKTQYDLNLANDIQLPPDQGRLSIRDIVILCLCSEPSDLSCLLERAGLNQNYSITLPRLSQAIFRQEQAVRLTGE